MESSVSSTHLLFMDDIMHFGHGLVKELEKLKKLLGLCHDVVDLEINMNKSLVLLIGLEDGVKA